MKYRLKDLCSITKGATGIMKADGGKYPLVALGEERKKHSEYQFDAKAVIVPLISSTGHGHASMKRVHYQEGKFALGNILCAVIPNDEKQLHPKYLHLYLQQFKDSLLVPLMKGAANVSLPMNKLAEVEIEVPSLDRQLEIIKLEEEAAEYKNELEERLIAQDGDVVKLRQTILGEAMQGKLTPQNPKDGNGKDLLENIKAEKAKSGKKEKTLQPIKPEEIPFEIPENWVWCRLGDITEITRGKGPKYSEKGVYKMLNQKCVRWFNIDTQFAKAVDENWYKEVQNNYIIKQNDVLVNSTGDGTIGRCAIADKKAVGYIFDSHVLNVRSSINQKFICYLINSDYGQQLIEKVKGATSTKQTELGVTNLSNFISPLPPLAEQDSIVKRIDQLMQLCDELQCSIQQSKIENEKLLIGALRDALKTEVINS
jgi:type I restriction enzyme S subunit